MLAGDQRIRRTGIRVQNKWFLRSNISSCVENYTVCVCVCVFVNLCHENSHNVGSEVIFDVGEQTNTIGLKAFNATFFSHLLTMHNLIYKCVTLKTF
jgi:hypothetical protein